MNHFTHFTLVELSPDRAYQIKTDATATEVEPENGTDFQLAEMYRIVECDCVELVDLRDGRFLWIDESGKYTKQTNEVASFLARNVLNNSDYIAGTALVCRADQVK